MGWSIGEHRGRDIGYSVPAYCDAPGCREGIDRGLGYVCGYQQPYGGEEGCGLFFCMKHGGGRLCKRCRASKPPYKRLSPDHPQWIAWKLVDASWLKWREQNQDWVKANDSPKARKLGKKLVKENT